MQIAVIGLGYIGLPTAGMLAINEIPTLGVDVNPDVVQKVSQGKVHFFEPGIRTVISAAVTSGNLKVSNILEPADFYFIAVPTPITKDKKADLSYVKSAAQMIAKVIQKGNTVILESTVPPGTTEDLVIPILCESGLEYPTQFNVAHSPERVIPGRVIKEIIENDRIIGANNYQTGLDVEKIYRSFVRGKIYHTDLKTAEFIKLIENSYRDVNIALANEIARIAEDLEINAWQAIDMANQHPRVNILNPGPGVGGHCIPVDPWFIVEKHPENARLIKQARQINDDQPKRVCKRISELLDKTGNGPFKISIWGITYKANVEDYRESPSLEIIRELKKQKHIKTAVYDPMVRFLEEFEMTGMQESIKDSDLLVILVGHDEFGFADPGKIGHIMNSKFVFDCVNIIDEKKWEKSGFNIALLGRGNNHKESIR